jgi:hypothetical protein
MSRRNSMRVPCFFSVQFSVNLFVRLIYVLISRHWNFRTQTSSYELCVSKVSPQFCSAHSCYTRSCILNALAILFQLFPELALLVENGVWVGVRFMCEGISVLCCESTNISSDCCHLIILGCHYEIWGYNVFVVSFLDIVRFLEMFLVMCELHLQHPQNGNSSPFSSCMLVALVSRLIKIVI